MEVRRKNRILGTEVSHPVSVVAELCFPARATSTLNARHFSSPSFDIWKHLSKQEFLSDFHVTTCRYYEYTEIWPIRQASDDNDTHKKDEEIQERGIPEQKQMLRFYTRCLEN